ncbi:hypothetical protein BMH32_03485 [Leucobacter sp. OLJS4]|uniref:hypothetical protein n=1 Tax=unclassified Leucobacter TaxID=2621730 RepID=UPI000C192425|nr:MULTISPECIES: hypothetical protein [unclassified Leucobacter]PII83256.1 hypothetical protein BMH25_07390 [Leucobacter sp. OLCALW19]PII86807.1 hypothetical protein BMH26_10765 [Leucobacter sp. OLTLW20]PII91257.1 hypothetical protein BMH27_08465 [Leucobacter sp. OLAS13]PII96851.1 hypothetical protein BMH28_14190 [Leucobacter sp. OLCS4]PII98717.1 hypothetical protein BMH29_07175 [Leucobacter sp. OLDS2]
MNADAQDTGAAQRRAGLRARIPRAIETALELLYPGDASGGADSHQARVEARALGAATLAAAAAILVGLVVFGPGTHPLWGAISTGSIGTLLAGLVAIASSIAEQLRAPMRAPASWSLRAARTQRFVGIAAVALVHGGIAVIGIGMVFAVLSQGFFGVQLDQLTSTVASVIVAAGTAYLVTVSAAKITTAELSMLLSMFLTGGIVVAMLTTSDAEWWHFHFSELGAGTDVSGLVFNLTLFLGGLLLAAFAFTLLIDLEAWAAAAPPSRTRNARAVAWGFQIIGICLAGVGIVPVNLNLIVHNTFATGMAVVFGAILIGLRWLLDGFTRVFLLFSDVVLAAIVFAALLFWPLGYYNLAAFELVVAGVIFAWLIIFVRHVGAAVPSGASAHRNPTVSSPERSR